MAWVHLKAVWARPVARAVVVGVAVLIGAAACAGGSGAAGAVLDAAPYSPPTVTSTTMAPAPPPAPSTTTTTLAPPSPTVPAPSAPSVVATATAPAEPATPATTPVTTESACAAAVAYIAAHGAPGWNTVCGYHAGYDVSDCVAAARSIGGALPYGCTDTYTLTSYIACPVFVVYANEAENQRYEAGLGGRFDAFGEAPQCAWANPLGG
ncbi:MAG: hypothetical protein ACRDZ8_06685 [Acidimicrobiales bacterium]